MSDRRISPKELKRIAEQSKNSTFSLWYDKLSGVFSTDYPSSPDSRWIFDVDGPVSPGFIEEITRIVLEFIEQENLD